MEKWSYYYASNDKSLSAFDRELTFRFQLYMDSDEFFESGAIEGLFAAYSQGWDDACAGSGAA